MRGGRRARWYWGPGDDGVMTGGLPAPARLAHARGTGAPRWPHPSDTGLVSPRTPCGAAHGPTPFPRPGSTGKRQVGAPARIGQGCSFRSFATDRFRLHFLEPPSGLKFVLLTDPGTADMSEALRAIYAGPFIQHVAKNPLYRPGDAFL